jgi:hypothetical protein
MTEKAVIGGKITIALGILCIVFIAGLGAAIASYSSIINSKDVAHQDYVSTHSHENSEFNALDASITDYKETHSYTDSQYREYVANHHYTDQEFNSAAIGAKLVTVNVQTEDNWSILPYDPPSTFLVYGYVDNAGSNIAYNPKIHVVAFKLYDVKAIDDYITLDDIAGGSWTTFTSTFTYNGGPLAHWTITPEWTTTP